MREPRYLLILLALALAAWLGAGAVPLRLLMLGVGVALTDLLWAWLGCAGLDARYGAVSGPFTAGDGIRTELRLRRPPYRRTGVFLIRDARDSRLRFSAHRDGEVLAAGAGGRAVAIRRTLPALRGRYRLGPLEILARGPFGLFESVHRVEGEEVTVWPRLYPLPVRAAALRRVAGVRLPGSAGAVDPVSAAGVRPLLPTDPPRLIHWKRSAALGNWYVRELDSAADATGVVVLDLAGAAYPGDRKVCDAAVEVAASLAQAAVARGQTVHLRSTGRRPIDLRLGSHGLPVALEALALAEADGQLPLGDWLRVHGRQLLPAGGFLAVVSPEPADRWGEELIRLLAMGVAVTGVEVAGPQTDVGEARRRAVRLHRMGAWAWAASGAEDLARQMVAGDGALDREAAGR